MSLTLKELNEWPPQIADLAGSAREAAANHINSADFYRSLATASTWQGDGGDAARMAMAASANDHDAAAENLDKAAAAMARAQHDAEVVANEITSIFDDANEQPVVQIDESTNQVIPPSTDYLDEDAAAKVAAKVADVRARIVAVLSKGELVDADLARTIATATGVPKPEVRTASSLDDLMLGDTGERRPPPPPAGAASSPDSLGDALDQLAGKPVHEPASGATAGPLPLDPKAIETFKNTARTVLQRDGVSPDQIEQRLDAMVAAAQRPQSTYVAPEPESMPPPGFGDGFADRWFATEQGIKNLLGQGGPGAPGVLESWGEMAKGTGERLTNPIGAAFGDVKDALDSPSAAYYLGEKSADAAVAAPGLIFGGEGLLARGAVVDDLAGSGDPTAPYRRVRWTPPVDQTLPTGGGGHSGGIGDDTGSPGGHGAPGGNPLPFDVDSQLPTARPEFTLANPLDHMSPELRSLSEQNLSGSGETVLGPYAPVSGGPSYIQVADDMGASYFDIGDAWNTSTPTQQLAANQHVLDIAVTNRDVIKLSVPYYEVRPDTYTGAELRYIQERGYQRIDETTFVPPNIGG